MQLVTGVTEALQLAPQVTDVHVQAAIMLGMTTVQDMLVKEGLGQGLALRSRAIRRRMASMRTRSSARLKGFGR